MKINPYLIFDGQCKAAFTFYAQCLGGTLEAMLSFAENPDGSGQKMPPELRERIMHARLVIGDQVLMASDTMPNYGYDGIKGCSISLQIASVAEAERLFAELSVDGDVKMPLQQTFWAVRFAMFVDRFGVPWMINCETDA